MGVAFSSSRLNVLRELHRQRINRTYCEGAHSYVVEVIGIWGWHVSLYNLDNVYY